MGWCARSARSRVFSHFLATGLALLFVLQCQRCSAGLAGLNLLPHKQLHKGRGIAEQNGSESTTPSSFRRVEAMSLSSSPQPSSQAVVHTPSPGIVVDSAKLKPTPKPKRSGKLDIVLTHFHPNRVQPALDFWLDFLESEKVQQWEPYVWIYCQNENMTNSTELDPFLKYGGEIVHLENVGRESHSFLQHITRHYHELANYTLFSQDIPEAMLVERFERMFDNNTGFLPLSIVGHVDCNDEWLPSGAIPQLYSMLTKQLCPPEGYTAAFEGQFIVSKKRVLEHNWWVYRNMLEMVAAPLDHWVHNLHNIQTFKDRSNPLFGHALERAWSLAFNCFESWRQGNCMWCDNDMHMENCGTDACQCLDL